ncbi:interleukin-1 receptor-associated kinase 1 [Spea bombifrons]|uniref:interleukin-1 receptor-associated kinase 1 n=1 Tax=Spea bombifrons TaxID=233779 RepID=UPI0023497FD5|nr:interleukin-1 receptor-associated kinase 1 [Spea bombifrons]
MSSCPIEDIFLYKVPAYTMCRFYEIMDSLDDSLWKKFASMIVPDQTQLRLLEQHGLRSRTEEVIWQWINKNARVGDLLSVLTTLELLRALDVFENWRSECKSRLSPSQNAPQRRRSSPPPPYPHPCPAPEPCPAEQQEKKQQPRTGATPTQPYELPPLPLPEPPPEDLLLSSTCPSQASSTGGSSDRALSSIHSSVQESVVSTGFVETTKHFVWNFNELVQGTNNFSRSLLIGEGGFGCVYRATMRNTEYAVKRLKQDSELEWSTVKKSFLTEIDKLTCLRHPNIIDLAGYCVQGEEYCLVYLYLANGSLEDRLHHQGSFSTLSWQQRVGIMQGAACGIQFLHTCQPSIIHGDVKSSNILLDQALVPKLGDFGLARFSRFSNDAGKSRTVAQTSTVRGTLAYLPDEYVKMGKLTFELDTYSFGVVLLEILTGRKAIECEGKSQTKYLKDLVKEEEASLEDGTSAGRLNRLSRVSSRICRHHLDSSVGLCPADAAQELSLLACRCLERQKKRPDMVEVFNTLKKLHESLHVLEFRKGYETPQPSAMQNQSPVLEDITSSLKAMVLSPEENTDRYTPYGNPAAAIAKGSVRPFSSSVSQYEANLDSCSGISSCKRTFQKGPNTPVESDESVPDFCDTAASRGHSDLNVLHSGREQSGHLAAAAAFLSQNPAHKARTQLPPANTLSGQYYYSSDLAGDNSLSSAGSPAILVPHHQIVVNPAKQRIVEQLALYDQGKINSLELLSSGVSPGQLSGDRRYPEESDDFPS